MTACVAKQQYRHIPGTVYTPLFLTFDKMLTHVFYSWPALYMYTLHLGWCVSCQSHECVIHVLQLIMYRSLFCLSVHSSGMLIQFILLYIEVLQGLGSYNAYPTVSQHAQGDLGGVRLGIRALVQVCRWIPYWIIFLNMPDCTMYHMFVCNTPQSLQCQLSDRLSTASFPPWYV